MQIYPLYFKRTDIKVIQKDALTYNKVKPWQAPETINKSTENEDKKRDSEVLFKYS